MTGRRPWCDRWLPVVWGQSVIDGPRRVHLRVLGYVDVSHARMRSSAAVVLAGLVGVCIALWFLRGALGPAPAPVSAIQAGVAAQPTTSPPTLIEQPAHQPTTPELPPRPEPREPREPPEFHGNDAVDPCTASTESTIPSGLDTAIAQGITVAWLPSEATNPGLHDTVFQPTAIAYLINGLLEEAAALTGTSRRERLTVIIYPSHKDYLARTGAPAWSGGVYDGGAVHVPADPSGDLGVGLPGLRHELMHAQLHTAVGCMPAWFNEGLAMYFAGTPPDRQWVRMLRSPDGFALASLAGPTLADTSSDQAERAYAESLAMIVFLLRQSGAAGFTPAVQALQAAARESPRAALTLWDRLYPGAGHREVLNVLAQKVFGVALGGELDVIFKSAICCYGFRTVHAFGCRGAPPRPDKRSWIDETSAPRAACRATW